MARSSAEIVIRVLSDVKSAQAGLQKVASTTSAIGSKVKSGMGRAISTVATMTAALVGITAGVTAGVIKQGVEYNVLQQRARAAFTTILGSAKAADKMMANLAKFSKTSPFPRQVFIQATQQMLAFGFAAKDVIPTLDAVQNAVAAAGGSGQDISEIVDILSKVKSTGKITAETLNQLGYRGVDAAKIIGEQMGTTGAAIREQITKGTLGADKAISALTKGMATKFAGAAAGLKGTWVGATDAIKAATRDLGSALVAPFINPKGGGYAVVWANQLADILRGLESTITPILTNVLGKLTPIFDAITTALGNVDVASVFESISSALSGLAPLIGPIVAGLTAMGTTNLAGLLGPFETLVPAINPVAAALIALIAVMPELRSAFAQILPVVMSLAKTIASTLGPALKSAMPALHELAATVGTVLVMAVKAVAPVIAQLVKSLAPLLPIVTKVASVIAKVLGAGLMVIVPLVASFVGWLVKMPGPLKAIVVVIGLLVVAQWAWNAALLANPVGLVIVAIVALVGVIALVVKRLGGWQAIWAAVKAAGVAAINGVRAAFQAVGNALRAVANAVLAAFKRAWSGIRAAASAVVSGIRASFNVLRAGVYAVANGIRAVFSRVWSSIRSGASAVASYVRAAFNRIRSTASSVVSAVRSAFAGLWSALKAGASAVGNALSRPFNAVRGAVNAAIGAVRSLIGWLSRIKIPKISVPGLKSGRSVAATSPTVTGLSSSARSLGAAARVTPASAGVTIQVNGALDPDAVARQIGRIIGAHDRRTGQAAGLRTRGLRVA